MSGDTANLLIWFAAGMAAGLFLAMVVFAVLVVVERRALRRRLRLQRSARAIRESERPVVRPTQSAPSESQAGGATAPPPQGLPQVVVEAPQVVAAFAGTLQQTNPATVRVGGVALGAVEEAAPQDEDALFHAQPPAPANPPPPAVEQEPSPAAEQVPSPSSVRTSTIVDPAIAAAAARRRAAKAAREAAELKAARDAELAIALKEAAAASEREQAAPDDRTEWDRPHWTRRTVDE